MSGRAPTARSRGKVIEHLTHLIATVSPGAKLGSTAPYAYADLMLIEAGSRQPRSLANAYRKALDSVDAQTANAVKAKAEHLGKLEASYGAHEARRVMCLDPWDIPNAERLCPRRSGSVGGRRGTRGRGLVTNAAPYPESRSAINGLRRRGDR